MNLDLLNDFLMKVSGADPSERSVYWLTGTLPVKFSSGPPAINRPLTVKGTMVYPSKASLDSFWAEGTETTCVVWLSMCPD